MNLRPESLKEVLDQVTMLGLDDAMNTRLDFFDHFADTTTSSFADRVGTLHRREGGWCHLGCIFDVLLNPQFVTEREAWEWVEGYETVLVMWDIYDSAWRSGAEYLELDTRTVLKGPVSVFRAGDHLLPPDYYVFSEDFGRVAAFTHEDTPDGDRYCVVTERDVTADDARDR